MTDTELEHIVGQLLDSFYAHRIQKLEGLKLANILKRKNPYRFCAIGMQEASEIVETLLQTYLSSSDEGIFSDVFFEPPSKGGEASGQVFWQELTGDPTLYLRIIRVMQDRPTRHKVEFDHAWAAAVNRFTAAFVADFCRPDGRINWEALVEFNSGARE
nr:PmeII family type II restriction endonuclease [Oscillochloris sp. ZM17-4]